MRYAIFIHMEQHIATLTDDSEFVPQKMSSTTLERIRITYELITSNFFTPATPSLMNAGVNIPQMVISVIPLHYTFY